MLVVCSNSWHDSKTSCLIAGDLLDGISGYRYQQLVNEDGSGRQFQYMDRFGVVNEFRRREEKSSFVKNQTPDFPMRFDRAADTLY